MGSRTSGDTLWALQLGIMMLSLIFHFPFSAVTVLPREENWGGEGGLKVVTILLEIFYLGLCFFICDFKVQLSRKSCIW